jgi:CubicO group peptidase (beta-lactamase class C family)
MPFPRDCWRICARAITPHLSNGSGGALVPYTKALPSSTLYRTLDDYGRFAEALLRPKPQAGFTLCAGSDQTSGSQGRYRPCLGAGSRSSRHARKVLFPLGANPGFESFFMVQPASRRGVLFLTDSDNGLDTVEVIVARYIPGTHPALRFLMLHPKD